MLVILGVLLLAAVAVYVVRKINERSRQTTDEDDFETPPTWEETEDLRYGIDEEDDSGWRNDPYERDTPLERHPPHYIPELDDPDRR